MGKTDKYHWYISATTATTTEWSTRTPKRADAITATITYDSVTLLYTLLTSDAYTVDTSTLRRAKGMFRKYLHDKGVS